MTRSYAAFSQLAAEGAVSRIHGGIHFLFEITASQASCMQVADYLADHYMRRKH